MRATRIPPTRPEHTTRDPEALVPDIRAEEAVSPEKRYGYLTQDKWVVDTPYGAKPQYGKPHLVTVWSPCCGQQRQRIQHGYAFSCSACGWWWRYHCLGWTVRISSVGKEAPK